MIGNIHTQTLYIEDMAATVYEVLHKKAKPEQLIANLKFFILQNCTLQYTHKINDDESYHLLHLLQTTAFLFKCIPLISILTADFHIICGLPLN